MSGFGLWSAMLGIQLLCIHILVAVATRTPRSSSNISADDVIPFRVKTQNMKRVTAGVDRVTVFNTAKGNFTWPYREQVAVIEGNITLGGLMMVHERDEQLICGKIMPQGGLQATEMMLYTVRRINEMGLIPGVRLGARIKDDCDRDIYGLEQSVDFIRGESDSTHAHNDILCMCIPSRPVCCWSYYNVYVKANIAKHKGCL